MCSKNVSTWTHSLLANTQATADQTRQKKTLKSSNNIRHFYIHFLFMFAFNSKHRTNAQNKKKNTALESYMLKMFWIYWILSRVSKWSSQSNEGQFHSKRVARVKPALVRLSNQIWMHTSILGVPSANKPKWKVAQWYPILHSDGDDDTPTHSLDRWNRTENKNKKVLLPFVRNSAADSGFGILCWTTIDGPWNKGTTFAQWVSEPR